VFHFITITHLSTMGCDPDFMSLGEINL